MPNSTRTSRPLLRIAVVFAALTQLSCAAAGLTPVQHSQPVERMGLAPEYRIFYDALQDQGDWVFIQPVGYVFRPNVNFITWRPYEDGFWAPTDIYGWTWISAEPFGWATYHYGSWFYDRYYGWVWAPGRDWGPAWVAWQIADDYAGWSPLLNPGPSDDQIRGGAWSYAPLSALGTTALSGRLLHDELHSRVQSVQPVRNLAEHAGVTFNRGPAFDLVERRTGPIPRVSIEPLGDLEPAGPGGGGARPQETRGGTRAGAQAGDRAAAAAAAIAAVRRAAEEEARTARGLADREAPLPASVHVVRPFASSAATRSILGQAKGRPRAPAGRKGGAADSTAR